VLYSVEADGIDTRIELGDGCPHRRLKPQGVPGESHGMLGFILLLIVLVGARLINNLTLYRKDKKVMPMKVLKDTHHSVASGPNDFVWDPIANADMTQRIILSVCADITNDLLATWTSEPLARHRNFLPLSNVLNKPK